MLRPSVACHRLVLLLLFATLGAASLRAQGPPPPVPDGGNNNSTSPAEVGHGAVSYEDFMRTVEENRDEAWKLLALGAGDKKHPERRVETLAALSLLGGDARSVKLIASALADPDPTVRTAAVLAAKESQALALKPALQPLVHDSSPEVAAAAARALGAAPVGDGAAAAGPVLGPFGLSPESDESLRKLGGDPARMAPVLALADDKKTPHRLQLIADLKDKDPGVRAAAAETLGGFNGTDVLPALQRLFDDHQAPVRLMAAAAYLQALSHMTPPPKKKYEGPSLQPDPF